MVNPKYSRYYTYVKPIVENKFVKSSTPIVFSLIAIAIFAVLAIRPTITTILSLQKTIINNQQVLDALMTKAQNLSQGKSNLDNLGAETLNQINTALPKDPEIASFIKFIQSTNQTQASSSALQIQPLTLLDKSYANNSHTMKEIEFTYTIQGAYPQIISTLQNIQKLPRLVSINNVIISKQESGNLRMVISGKFFRII